MVGRVTEHGQVGAGAEEQVSYLCIMLFSMFQPSIVAHFSSSTCTYWDADLVTSPAPAGCTLMPS